MCASPFSGHVAGRTPPHCNLRVDYTGSCRPCVIRRISHRQNNAGALFCIALSSVVSSPSGRLCAIATLAHTQDSWARPGPGSAPIVCFCSLLLWHNPVLPRLHSTGKRWFCSADPASLSIIRSEACVVDRSSPRFVDGSLAFCCAVVCIACICILCVLSSQFHSFTSRHILRARCQARVVMNTDPSKHPTAAVRRRAKRLEASTASV